MSVCMWYINNMLGVVMCMEFKTSDNVRLEYDDEGTGTPIIILTGIGGSRKIWRSQMNKLVREGYRVINVDSRNQGASQRTSKGMRISRHAADIHELISILDLHNIIFLGNSMGASTFFAYISVFGDRSVQAIVDVDQSPKMINDRTWHYGFKDLTWDTFPDDLKFPMGPATYENIDDKLFEIIKQENKMYPYSPDSNYQFLIDHAFQDWRDVIQSMSVPLLVVAGKRSPYFNSKFANETAKMAKNGFSEIIENCGHIIMAERPKEFWGVLKRFLNHVVE